MTVRAQPLEMSYEAFLEWVDEDVRAEWVDGKVIFLTPPSTRHQLLVRFLINILSAFVETSDSGILLPSPYQMKLGPNLSGREPDLLFVANENSHRIQKNRLAGPADLAVEIISPESRKRDQKEKFSEYEHAGVKEYWIIDYEREQAEFYHLNEHGVYQAATLNKGVFRSEVLEGLELDTTWLWQEPLPPFMHVLKVWGLV